MRNERWELNLQFQPDWQIEILPPFGGAVVRFGVKKGDRRVSVYFDAYNALGYVGQPYWEIYPAYHGDIERYVFGKEDEMLEGIRKSLEERVDDFE